MTCNDAEAMLGAYALDALTPDERQAVAAHLAGCPLCRAALARYVRATTALGLGVAPVSPPPALARRLMAEIGHPGVPAPPVAPAPAVATVRRADGSLLWRWAAGGLATAAALLIVGLVVVTVLLRQTQEARNDAVADRREIAEYLGAGGTITALTPAPGASAVDGRGSLIVAPNQPRAALVVSGLTTDGGQHYRVWVERAGTRTWLADLEVASDGIGYLIVAAPEPLTTYDTVGIALETPGQAAQDILVAPIGGSSGA